jgi:predicted DCC family thiol-disulfide oxidoreductase YuxK
MSAWKLKLLYDGECPFCRREVEWLKRRNRRMLLRFEDISDPQFDPGRYGLTREEVNRALHGVLPDGKVVRGMAAVRRAYRAVGLGWLAGPTGWPGVRWIADRLYAAFARNRAMLGRFAGGGCAHGTCGASGGVSGSPKVG